MKDIRGLLIKEISDISKIIEKATKSLEVAPEGKLKISKSHGKMQYYNRLDSSKAYGKYINKKDISLAHKLAQKDYDALIIEKALERKKSLEELYIMIESTSITDIYNNLPKERQELITPYILTEEQYIIKWQEKEYIGKGFLADTSEIYTEKGERVRSKSEKIIADKLNLMNIPYHYEYPLKLKGFGTIYPDFFILNRRTRREYYLEHFGLMDNTKYCEKAIKKIDTYAKNGIFQGDKLLITYETSDMPLNMKYVERLINRYFT